MPDMDFGVTIRPTPHGGTLSEMHATNARLLAAAREHRLSCWVIDHFQFGTDPIMECLAFLAFLAGSAPGLRWGTLVLGQGYRNPALTAKIAATLQHLTDERFILGIGGGDAETEHRAYGYGFPPARERIAQLDEAAQIIKLLWRGERTTFAGAHYHVADALCLPAPQPPPPLMIGGAGERRTLRVVATHADWWNADYYSPAEYAHKLAVLHTHCRAVGRDAAAIVPSCYMGITVSHDPATLVRRRFMGHRGEVHVISGDPDAVTAQIAAFAAAGVRHMHTSSEEGGHIPVTSVTEIRGDSATRASHFPCESGNQTTKTSRKNRQKYDRNVYSLLRRGVRHMQLNFLDFPRTDSLDLFLADVLPRFTPTGT